MLYYRIEPMFVKINISRAQNQACLKSKPPHSFLATLLIKVIP